MSKKKDNKKKTASKAEKVKAPAKAGAFLARVYVSLKPMSWQR